MWLACSCPPHLSLWGTIRAEIWRSLLLTQCSHLSERFSVKAGLDSLSRSLYRGPLMAQMHIAW